MRRERNDKCVDGEVVWPAVFDSVRLTLMAAPSLSAAPYTHSGCHTGPVGMTDASCPPQHGCQYNKTLNHIDIKVIGVLFCRRF